MVITWQTGWERVKLKTLVKLAARNEGAHLHTENLRQRGGSSHRDALLPVRIQRGARRSNVHAGRVLLPGCLAHDNLRNPQWNHKDTVHSWLRLEDPSFSGEHQRWNAELENVQRGNTRWLFPGIAMKEARQSSERSNSCIGRNSHLNAWCSHKLNRTGVWASYTNLSFLFFCQYNGNHSFLMDSYKLCVWI